VESVQFCHFLRGIKINQNFLELIIINVILINLFGGVYMIVRVNEIAPVKMENPMGGRGEMLKFAYDQANELGGKIKMFSVIDMGPDSKVGEHEHSNDLEIYLILDGKPVVSDNGAIDILGPGDMLITKKGENHFIENKSNDHITFVALVLE